MTDSRNAEIALQIAALAEVFERELTEPMVSLYIGALEELSIEEIRLAVKRCVQRCTFMPRPAELLIAAKGRPEDAAALAWNDVLKSQPIGAYKHVDFENKLINATIRALGGWPAMFERCATPESEKFYRLDFIKVYQGFSNTDVSDEAVAPLAGINEAEIGEVNGKPAKIAPIPRPIGCHSATENNRKLGAPRSKDVPRVELKTP